MTRKLLLCPDEYMMGVVLSYIPYSNGDQLPIMVGVNEAMMVQDYLGESHLVNINLAGMYFMWCNNKQQLSKMYYCHKQATR